MGMTMTQKILAAHAGLDSVTAGQLIEADLYLTRIRLLLYRITSCRTRTLNLQNTANVFVNLP